MERNSKMEVGKSVRSSVITVALEVWHHLFPGPAFVLGQVKFPVSLP